MHVCWIYTNEENSEVDLLMLIRPREVGYLERGDPAILDLAQATPDVANRTLRRIVFAFANDDTIDKLRSSDFSLADLTQILHDQRKPAAKPAPPVPKQRHRTPR